MTIWIIVVIQRLAEALLLSAFLVLASRAAADRIFEETDEKIKVLQKMQEA